MRTVLKDSGAGRDTDMLRWADSFLKMNTNNIILRNKN
jgi:hypothetical protein